MKLLASIGKHGLAAVLAAGLGAGAAVAADDATVEKGSRVFAKNCGPCHMIGGDARHRVGPHLNELFGRKAGTAAGFKYSKGMAHAGVEGLVWSPRTLVVFLENPKSLVSRTRMSFVGLESEADRDALIAFLERYNASPRDIPEAPPTASHADIVLPPELLAAKGDPAYGEYLSGECVTCHKLDGDVSAGIPAITGWPSDAFKAALHAYREKIRPHPVMQMISARLSDEEIAALAAYFENQGP